MPERTPRQTRTRRLAWTGLVTLAVLITLLITVPSVPIAHAQEPMPPPGDCWNEALSRDKLHCYFLEEAQRAGEIEVAAVYVAPGNGPLYIFLEQTTPITDDVAQLFEAKAHEYMEKESPAASHYTVECGGYTGDERKDCLNDMIGYPVWQDFESHNPFSRAVPGSNIYERIVIDVGGSEARRRVPGWASWRQVWPTAAPGPSGSSGFDVSDVDLTNIRDPDCEDIVSDHIGRACHSWQLDTSVGVAGVYNKYKYDVQVVGSNDRVVVETLEAVYLQLKVSDPDDEEEMQALRDRLHPDTFGPDWEVITIPVKYDFGELWRWNVILDRFAVSAGNTVGITSAEVAYNSPGHGFNEEPRVWMNGVEPLRRDGTGSGDDPDTVRTILMVWAVDPHLAAEALPELLPELGIPADAVGVVKHDNTTPVILTHAAGSGGTVSRLQSAVARVGVDSDGNPISVNFGGRSYPPTRTESAAVQRPDTSETDLDNETTPDQQSISPPASGERARSEPKATASDTERSDTRELNRQTAGDVTSSRSASPSWLLMSVAGVLALAVLCAAILITLRIRFRRA